MYYYSARLLSTTSAVNYGRCMAFVVDQHIGISISTGKSTGKSTGVYCQKCIICKRRQYR